MFPDCSPLFQITGNPHKSQKKRNLPGKEKIPINPHQSTVKYPEIQEIHLFFSTNPSLVRLCTARYARAFASGEAKLKI